MGMINLKYIKEHMVFIIISLALLIMLLGVLFWNKVINYQSRDNQETTSSSSVNVSDANNVESVESKLGQPMKITQSYLIRYTTKKSGIWYMSSAVVKSVSIKNDTAIIKLISEDKKDTIVGTIDSDKATVKNGDLVNFVGTIDFDLGGINLTKISKDTINYINVTKMEFGDLVNNINAIVNNQFIISGYMVTDGDKYKLFESKNSYNINDSVGSYFVLEWKEEFGYTGTSSVIVQCYIGDTYRLKDCELLDN